MTGSLIGLLLQALLVLNTLDPVPLQPEEGVFFPVLIRPVTGSLWADVPEPVLELPRGAERRAAAADFLRARSLATQQDLLRAIDSMDDQVRDPRSFWIVNCIICSATREGILALSSREDVEYARVMGSSGSSLSPVAKSSGRHPEPLDTAWGVAHIGAPDVWHMGYTGSGVVVSIVDTGVNYNHLDLLNHMWHDTDSGLHYGWDFCDNDPDPMDEMGHGTHCAGIVGSDGSAGTTCGVAPGATIMALRVDVSVGPSAEQTIWDAFQFSIDNGADIVSTSLGYTQLMNPQRTEWREAEENLLAAGICHAVSAGSEGGDPGSWGDIRTPGDCPPPWLHPEQSTTGGLSAVVTVGKTDSSDYLMSFSSLGYSTWMFDSPWFDYPDTPPDIGLIDPDVCAPGESIPSCDWQDVSGYSIMSGSSMSTPHVAGLMALMLDANQFLSPSQVDSILETTALELGSPGKDNYYGSGRIRAVVAVQAALEVGVSTPEPGGAPAVTPALTLSVCSNPSCGSALLETSLDRPSDDLVLTVFDCTGRIVWVRSAGFLPAGTHQFEWVPAGDCSGPGVYLVLASCASSSASARFTLLR